MTATAVLYGCMRAHSSPKVRFTSTAIRPQSQTQRQHQQAAEAQYISVVRQRHQQLSEARGNILLTVTRQRLTAGHYVRILRT